MYSKEPEHSVPEFNLCPLVQLRGYGMVSETFAMKAKVKAEQARYADLIAEERVPSSFFPRSRQCVP